MHSRNLLICFTGVDGSGKTTHAIFLKEFLEERGYSCKYVWGASRPFLSYFFFVFTRALGYWKSIKRNAYTDPLEHAPRQLVVKLSKIWRLCLYVDIQLKVLLKIRLPLLMGNMVICDRYFYDLLMELQLSNAFSERFLINLSKSLPKPIVTFLMNVPTALAESRRGFSHQYYEKRRDAFMDLRKAFGFKIIDSSKEISNNQRTIRLEILRRT